MRVPGPALFRGDLWLKLQGEPRQEPAPRFRSPCSLYPRRAGTWKRAVLWLCEIQPEFPG